MTQQLVLGLLRTFRESWGAAGIIPNLYADSCPVTARPCQVRCYLAIDRLVLRPSFGILSLILVLLAAVWVHRHGEVSSL